MGGSTRSQSAESPSLGSAAVSVVATALLQHLIDGHSHALPPAASRPRRHPTRDVVGRMSAAARAHLAKRRLAALVALVLSLLILALLVLSLLWCATFQPQQQLDS